MEATVIAALIAACVSLVLGIANTVSNQREKRRERQLAAREKLDKYRAPLLAAVDELGRRINNIRNDHFLAYLDTEDRRDTALLSTLFRFAQYFGWTEIIRGYSDRLRFESDTATRTVTALLNKIGWIFATDHLDRTDEDDFTTSQFMLWRDERSALGELMRLDDHVPRCLSFHSFVESYDERFSKWFARFAADFQAGSASKGHRLVHLHCALAELVRELDVDRVLVQLDSSGQLTKPRWAQPSFTGIPTRISASTSTSSVDSTG